MPREMGEYILSEPAEQARQRVLLAAKRCGWVHTRDLWGWSLFAPGPDLPTLLPGRLKVRITGHSPTTHVQVEAHRVPTQARAGKTVQQVLDAIDLLPEEAQSKRGAARGERLAVSGLMIVLLLTAAFAGVRVGVPKKTVPASTQSGSASKTTEVDNLPATALEQPWLYHAEVGVAVFLGGLFILTPAFIGIVRGHLPIEISSRGVKFGEETATADETMLRNIKRIELRMRTTEARVGLQSSLPATPAKPPSERVPRGVDS